MGTNCAPLVADLFYFVMRETSYCLFLIILKQMLLKHCFVSWSTVLECISKAQ